MIYRLTVTLLFMVGLAMIMLSFVGLSISQYRLSSFTEATIIAIIGILLVISAIIMHRKRITGIKSPAKKGR